MKFDMVARFRETIPTMRSVRHSRSRKISKFDQNYHFTIFQKIRISRVLQLLRRKPTCGLISFFLKNMYEILQLIYVLYEECN